MMRTDSRPPSQKNWWLTSLIPYVPKPKGTPWYAVNWAITAFFFFVPVWFAVIFASGLANAVPMRSELQILHGKLIKIHQAAPHLLIALPDGKLRSMEFSSFDTIGKRYYFVREEDAKKLIGCHVEIRGVPLRWTLGNNRFRVFELLCPERSVLIGGLEQSTTAWISGRSRSIWPFLFLWLLVPVPALIYILFRERKFYRE